MKKRIFINVIIFVLLIAIGSLIWLILLNSKEKSPVSIVEDKSYFMDFEVKDDKVTYQCFLTLVNTSDVKKVVRLFAFSPKDVETGLLKTPRMSMLDNEGNIEGFTIPAQSEFTTGVIFEGEYGGTYKKNDRLLPEIVIEIIE